MNLQETGTILDVLETAYPRMFSGPGAVDRTKALGLWAKMFEDDRVDLVAAAVKSYIATDVKGFPPHIGAIKNAMHQLSSAGGLDAAQAGAATIAAQATGGWVFDAMGDGMTSWINTHGAEWITAISSDSRQAIQALIGAGVTGQYTVDELSRAIRPLIGLNKPQAAANLRYYTQVRDNLLANNPNMKKATAEKAAKDAAMKYAARQHRYRAFTIATTETAFAYNFGYSEYIRQAQAGGYMGDGHLVVDTAGDSDVCPMCEAFAGQEYAIDQPFQGKALYQGQTMIPPFHPRCRCATHFEETAPPVFQPATAPPTAQNALAPWPGGSAQAQPQTAPKRANPINGTQKRSRRRHSGPFPIDRATARTASIMDIHAV